MTSPSTSSPRAVATVVARTRDDVDASSSPSKTSISSPTSTAFSVARSFDKPPLARPAPLQSFVTPRAGDGAHGGGSRRPVPRVPGPRRVDDTVSDSLTGEIRAASQTMNVSKSSASSSSSLLSSSSRGQLAPTSASTLSKQSPRQI